MDKVEADDVSVMVKEIGKNLFKLEQKVQQQTMTLDYVVQKLDAIASAVGGADGRATSKQPSPTPADRRGWRKRPPSPGENPPPPAGGAALHAVHEKAGNGNGTGDMDLESSDTESDIGVMGSDANDVVENELTVLVSSSEGMLEPSGRFRLF